MDPDFDIQTDLQTQSLLLAAANHDISALRDLLRTGSANVQDTETGFTPLHAAVAACEPDEAVSSAAQEPLAETNGHSAPTTNGNGPTDAAPVTPLSKDLDPAARTIKLLFQNGAIWNDLDANNETAGCIALRLGLKELYDLIVDAGVRAELLLSRLDEYQPLGDNDNDSEEEDEEEVKEEVVEETPTREATATDSEPQPTEDVSANNASYIASNLTFSDSQLLDSSNNGVMMAWEKDIMQRSADLLCPVSNLRVLNVGHGMGIIDDIFQSHSPSSHHIVEAHPDVLQKMKVGGWYEKPGVTIHEGRWQDIIPALVEKNEMFDAIYFDTFAEEYKALREFFTEHVIGLLDPAGGKDNEGGRFGFFNGMGADRQVCYDVYGKIVEMDLYEAGFDIDWEEFNVPDLQAAGEWNGLRRSYWTLKTYRLPTCRFID